MATFFMFGKYTLEGIKGMSGARTKKIVDIIKKAGGEVRSMHALLGEKDLVFIVDFPSNEEAIKASVAITKLTGIGFTTSPAITVEEFDRLTSGK
ncbi:MAG: hypothetical protein Fur0020_14370 [Thermodesulfovibrionia bacterium]